MTPILVQLLNHLDTLLMYLIVSVSVLAIVSECRGIYRDCVHHCQATAEGIRLLRSHPRAPAISLHQLHPSQIRWLLDHVDGYCPQDRPTEFHLKRQQEHIVCLTYPSILMVSAARRPVTPAPTLLTTLSLIETLSGLYRGVQGMRLSDMTQGDLLETSTELVMGMHVALATALWGLASASLLLVLVWVGERVRVWRRGHLRSQFSQIAIWRPPEQLLEQLVRRFLD